MPLKLNSHLENAGNRLSNIFHPFVLTNTIPFLGYSFLFPLQQFVPKLMRDNLQKVGDILISGGVDNMEKYQYMLGQARTYQLMLQEMP